MKILCARRPAWVALLFWCLAGAQALAATYESPDHAMIAVVTSPNPKDCEATIEIRSKGRDLARVAYTSPDHEHGGCVHKAAWTADSKFFVFNIESSGGHQPWHMPIMFFSRERGRVISLEDYVPDPITDEDFLLTAPDIIEFTTAKVPLRSLSLGGLLKPKSQGR